MSIGQCIEIIRQLGRSDKVTGAEQQACFIVASKLQHDLNRRRAKDERKKSRNDNQRAN